MNTDAQDGVSNERLKQIAAEYGNMADGLPAVLEDGPGSASAFYMSCSLGEISSIASELLSRRASANTAVTVKPLVWELDDENWWCAQPSVMIGGGGYEDGPPAYPD